MTCLNPPVFPPHLALTLGVLVTSTMEWNAQMLSQQKLIFYGNQEPCNYEKSAWLLKGLRALF